MKVLAILLCTISVAASAQQNNALYSQMTRQMSPQSLDILRKQMAAHNAYKTTIDKYRLVGHSFHDLQRQEIDTTYFGYSGSRGSSYINCWENINGFDGAFSKPDTIWRFANARVQADARFAYDSKDSVVSAADQIQQYRYLYTLDNAGNTIIGDYYDTFGGTQIYHRTVYSYFDYQNRVVYDSTPYQSKSVYFYGPGIDSAISYSWNSSLVRWDAIYKFIYVYNNIGLLSKCYRLSDLFGTHIWDSSARNSYTYNGNGFLTTVVRETYNQTIDVWENYDKEAYEYAGNDPLFRSYAYYEYDSGWTGIVKYKCIANATCNWDTLYILQKSGTPGGWDPYGRIGFTYNNFNQVTRLDFHPYNTSTGQYESAPTTQEYFYYKSYVPAAVMNIQASSAVIVYPNPVSGTLHIDGNIGSKNVSMQLIGINGALSFNVSGNWNTMNKDIDMSPFASGVYYLLITDHEGNKIAAKQIVKN